MGKKIRQYDLKDLAFRIALQWKAVLLFALIVALLFGGYKYYRSNNAYKAELAQISATEQYIKDPQAYIDGIYENLTPADRIAVKGAVQEYSHLEQIQEFINNPLLTNSQDDTVKIINIGYYIHSDANDSVCSALTAAYKSAFDSEENLQSIRNTINPDIPLKFVRKQIEIKGLDTDSFAANKSIVNEDENDNRFIAIRIFVMPETDEKEVISVVNEIVNERNESLSGLVADHTISQYYSDVQKTSDLDRWMKLSSSAENMEGNLERSITRLNDNQKAAYNQIIQLMEAATEQSAQAENTDAGNKEAVPVSRQGISIKDCFLGGILGILIYILAYFMVFTIKCRLGSAKNAKYYTDSSLVGEYYCLNNEKGILSLLHCKKLAESRYKEKLDLNVQTNKAVNNIRQIAENKNISKVKIISMLDEKEDKNGFIKSIAGKCSDTGDVSLSVVRNSDDLSELDMLDAKAAVVAVSDNTNVDELSEALGIIRKSETEYIGTAYVSEL